MKEPKIIPNIVGVDVGCGMNVTEFGKHKLSKDSLISIDHFIKINIPAGMGSSCELSNFNKLLVTSLLDDLRCKNIISDKQHIINSMGTLGGGNHFIELDKDLQDNLYLVIHTGSRNLGCQVASIYQNKAKKSVVKLDMKHIIDRLKSEGRQKEIQTELEKFKLLNPKIDPEFAYIEGQDFEDYIHDMKLCQTYAEENRKLIRDTIVNFLDFDIKNSWESVHNYIDTDNLIIRKGAIDASKGKKCIIPLNMKDGSIIGFGKGNEDWNNSAPHGAGRVMSRKKARENIDANLFISEMKKAGIYTSTANEKTVDEAPEAYKKPESITSLIKDTVDIVDVIKSIYNFKAVEDLKPWQIENKEIK